MISSLPQLVKPLLKELPKNDYPVLNTRLFVSCWLGFALDQSLTSMRDLFFRLKSQNITVDISTFSKASKQRSLEPLIKIYQQLCQQISQKNGSPNFQIFPIDSTTVTLTSKLLWMQGYPEVKLISGINLETGGLEESLVSFGKKHDINFGCEAIDAIPSNAVGVMDRGFASCGFISRMKQKQQLFVVRLNQNYKLEFVDNCELMQVGSSRKKEVCRVVSFCDVESRREYRLATNLPQTGEGGLSNAEIAEIYRQRWGI